MGELATIGATASSVASSGLKIAGGLGEGRAAKLEGQLKALDSAVKSERYKLAAEAGRVRATQTDATYRDELASTLANIDAITAAQGRGIDSATTRALATKAETINSRARQVAVSNEIIKALGADADASQARTNGEMARRAGQRAMDASMLKVLPEALSAAQAVGKAIPWDKL